MGNQRGGTKMDAVVKLVLVFFVSLLSFSVGTFVGKQVSDSDHRRAALEQDYKGAREIASENSDKDGGADKALSEDDIKSLTDEFVQAEKGEVAAAAGAEGEEGESHATRETASEKGAHEQKAEKDGYKKMGHKAAATEKHGAETHAATTEKHEEKHDDKAKHDATTAAAEKLADGHSPTKGESKDRQPNSVLPNVANASVGKFTVQVASYAEEDEAKTQAAELKEKGWNAFYLPVDIKGHKWFRVNVGMFANSKSAMSFREKFMKEAKNPSAIVQKIVQ